MLDWLRTADVLRDPVNPCFCLLQVRRFGGSERFEVCLLYVGKFGRSVVCSIGYLL